MAEEKTVKRNSFMTRDLWKILETYPNLHDYTIESVTLFYYPIAMMEMALSERSLEDFEAVQLAVLRLVGLKLTDPAIIAKTLCLTTDYARRVLQLLMGYGLLDSRAQLTELGQQSLNARRRVTMVNTTQVFQMDPLNGRLLPLDQILSRYVLVDADRIQLQIPVLRCGDGIPADHLVQQILEDRGDQFVHHNPGVFHVNVQSVNDARCTELCYAKSYLIKLANQPSPLCFAQRYDKTQDDPKLRTCFRPYSCPAPRTGLYLTMDERTAVTSQYANEFLIPFGAMLQQDRLQNPLTEEDARQMLAVHSLVPVRMELGGLLPGVTIDSSSIRAVTNDLLELLRQLALQDELFLADRNQHGWVLRIHPEEDEVLQELASQLSMRTDLDKTLVSKYKNYDGSLPLAQALLEEFTAKEDN